MVEGKSNEIYSKVLNKIGEDKLCGGEKVVKVEKEMKRQRFHGQWSR